MPRRQLPTGTVTLVFTDIEGSTRLLRQLGTGYTEELRTHRNRIREAFRAHGGTEVDTQGDAFFYAFPRAASAVAAAAAAQDAMREGLIRVRIGIHTGDPDTTQEGFIGLDVNQAARICAAAHGGQVVVSDSTARLVDVALRKLGSHRLKDLPTPQWLFQLGEGDFPPLRSLNNTNLPAELTTLIGRERTAEELASLARTSRLVTIVGAGGVGKTRVAIRVANMLLHDFNDGCWFVDLAAITDPASVSAALWSGLGLPTRGSPSQMEEVRRALMDKRCLVILDNCEHLGSSPATAATALVSGCPALHVLATSRQPLSVQGEHVYPLGPLETSAPGVAGASADSPAAELFIARASSQGYEGGDLGARDAIAELCSRLDGIPLAIELAAARARSKI